MIASVLIPVFFRYYAGCFVRLFEFDGRVYLLIECKFLTLFVLVQCGCFTFPSEVCFEELFEFLVPRCPKIAAVGSVVSPPSVIITEA